MSTGRNNVKRSNITACRRCKTRKQRCDQEVPACGNCARAGVECVGVGADGFAEPRSYIKSLEDYVAQLEQQLAPSRSRGDSGLAIARLTVPARIGTSYDLSLPVSTHVTIPDHTVLMALSEKYFEHSNFFSPTLDQSDMTRLSNAARSDETGPKDHLRSKFVVLIMLSTTMELMQRSKSNMHLPQPEAYRTAAFDILREGMDSIFTNDLDHLECLLLIVQSLGFASDLPNAWHFIGLATRLAISLDLHTEGSYWLAEENQYSNKARKLFWTMYNLERNICVVLGRPFSLPDTAITTDVPTFSSTSGFSRHAEKLVAYRRLESELYQMTREAPPMGDVAINRNQWRVDMCKRLHEWRESVPANSMHSKLAPESYWDGALSNALLRVYSPSRHMPDLTDEELDELRLIAIDTIASYRQSFREGELRFYWRTLHFLYLAGETLVHCANNLHAQLRLDHDTYSSIKESLDSCATVLWGMIERYPQSEDYRDRLDGLVSELTEIKPANSTFTYDMLETSAFYDIS